MALSTAGTLSAKTVEQLQDLIQANIDSRDGFRHAAEALEDLTLRSAFEQLAEDRQAQADELSRLVAWNGSTPRKDGSISAAVHRSWMSIRELVSSDDRHAMLSEAERGEDVIKGAYESALKEVHDSALNEVLMRQYSTVKAAHDRIRDLRDASAAGV